MVQLFSYKDHIHFESCTYGDSIRANRTVYDYHVFSFVTTLSLTTLLIFNSDLHKFYLPLARIVNTSLLLKLSSDILFFMYHPYLEHEGNCLEICAGRVYTILIMFGEMHQIYFIANILGLGNYKFTINRYISLTLESFLKIISILIIISIIITILTKLRKLFFVLRSLWLIISTTLQLYFIINITIRKNINSFN